MNRLQGSINIWKIYVLWWDFYVHYFLGRWNMDVIISESVSEVFQLQVQSDTK